MTRKIFIIVLVLIFLAASIAVGIFLVQRNSDNETEKNIAPGINMAEEIDVPRAAESIEEKKEEIPVPTEESSDPAGFSFAVIGDTQYFKAGAGGGYQEAVASIRKMDPALVFAVGDLVSSCDKKSECEEKLSAWKSVLGPLAARTYPAQGNHDRTGEEKADSAWEEAFDHLPENGPSGFLKFVYSFDFGNAHFVVLASDKPEENDISKEQLAWLEADLEKKANKNIFVFVHEPAYPTSSKIGESLDENPESRDRLWSILKKHGARAVFSGHEHIQSRRKVDGIYQFGFGNTDSSDHDPPKPGAAEYFHIGQAFGLVEVDGENVTVKTYSVGGDLLDAFKLPN